MPRVDWGRIQRALEMDLLILDATAPRTMVLPCGVKPMVVGDTGPEVMLSWDGLPREGIRRYWQTFTSRCFYCGCELTVAALCPHCGAPRRR